MPHLGTRQALFRQLDKACLTVIPALINFPQQQPSLFIDWALQIEVIKSSLLLLLDDSEDIVLLSLASLVLALQSNLLARSQLRALALLQQHTRSQYLKLASVLADALDVLDVIRYIEPRICEDRKDLRMILFGRIFNGRERAFVKFARMSKLNFFDLASKIRESPVFYNNPPKPQLPVEWQLLVTLANLGFSGNAGSAYIIGHFFGISAFQRLQTIEGTVHNFTTRCLDAILPLESNYVYWPGAEERVRIRNAIGDRAFFKNCVGFIDGTLLPFAFAPLKDPEDFWTRKFMYALNSLLVCDHTGRIIYALHGWCGSAHDQRVFSTTRLFQRPELFFSEGEYLIGDSGYTCMQHLIANFKRLRTAPLTPEKVAFNNALSELRVTIEHCNGMLKSRFQSLRECRMVLKDEDSARFINRWLRVCCILHNYLLSVKERWDPAIEEEDQGLIQPPEYSEVPPEETRYAQYSRRNSLFTAFKQWPGLNT